MEDYAKSNNQNRSFLPIKFEIGDPILQESRKYGIDLALKKIKNGEVITYEDLTCDFFETYVNSVRN